MTAVHTVPAVTAEQLQHGKAKIARVMRRVPPCGPREWAVWYSDGTLDEASTIGMKHLLSEQGYVLPDGWQDAESGTQFVPEPEIERLRAENQALRDAGNQLAFDARDYWLTRRSVAAWFKVAGDQ